jgi:fructokinase
LWNGSQIYEGTGFDVTVVDTVGAGDAFLAAVVSGYLGNSSPEDIIDSANRLGAFVTTKYGSTPHYDVQSLKDIQSLPLHSHQTVKQDPGAY